MKTDIEIAQEATLLPIKEVAANIGIKEDDLELYGKYKAKFDSHFMDEVKNNEDGKLVLVTAINPTPAGEGKTTTSVGVSQALNKLGKKTILLFVSHLLDHVLVSKVEQPVVDMHRLYQWKI